MRIMAMVLLTLVAVASCRVKKERVGGKTRVDIQGENVQVSTKPTTVKVGSETATVPVPQVHIGDSTHTADTTTASPAVPPPR